MSGRRDGFRSCRNGGGGGCVGRVQAQERQREAQSQGGSIVGAGHMGILKAQGLAGDMVAPDSVCVCVGGGSVCVNNAHRLPPPCQRAGGASSLGGAGRILLGLSGYPLPCAAPGAGQGTQQVHRWGGALCPDYSLCKAGAGGGTEGALPRGAGGAGAAEQRCSWVHSHCPSPALLLSLEEAASEMWAYTGGA
ncbi:hypothetical protein KIL84_015353 [Mauremys mutica]|uniref:Uncharacterized protein n=1 Tax=Mauremys mutica TaxID=74926 RepID=A0A9D3WSJ6_9SAUR|nr:hypothetical protein KIL84_015353 [Mauremys mutica]